MDVGPAELLIILAIVIVLFGSSTPPKLARFLGQAHREFRDGLAGGRPEEEQEHRDDTT